MVTLDNIGKDSLKKLEKHGFEVVKIKSKHESYRMKGACTLILYKTGKLLIQGSENEVAKAAKLIGYLGVSEKDKAPAKTPFSGVAVGSDEALKGDTFGGIVVAGFLADDAVREDLKAMHVRDSKALTNAQICEMAELLIKKYPDSFYVKNIMPEEYNDLMKRMNVTGLLDRMHAECFSKLRKGKAVHIVDQYPGCDVGDICETKAESRYYEVAAASIIARYFALKQIRELERKAGLFIPLGSTHVDGALLQLQKKKLRPEEYLKMNFSNVQKAFSKQQN